MSREIKFRAWDDERGQMFADPKWVEFHTDFGVVTARNYNREGNVQSLPIMQYTGLKDEHGREIYEGDIVHVDWDDGRCEPVVGVVEWDNEGVCWLFAGGSPGQRLWNNEIIGNIYENPELLKGE